MIDQFRKEIQDRLDQLLAEADKLRRALAALGSGEPVRTSGSRRDVPRALGRKAEAVRGPHLGSRP